MKQPFVSRTSLGVPAGLLASTLVLSVYGVAWLVENRSSDLYYLVVQEDEALEWATTWAFLLGACLAFASALKLWRSRHRLPWFLVAVGVFCFVVAMEEISWGQRILGYRPPDYFLSHNFQQELNVHNVVGTGLRKLAMKVVLLGYGVLLPLLVVPASLARLLGRLGIVAPPRSVIPGFLAAFWLYTDYPWTHSGEWVELMVGLGFLFSMVAAYLGTRESEEPRGEKDALNTGWLVNRRRLLGVGASCLAALGLGFSNASISRAQLSGNHALVATASAEAEALRRDFASGRAGSRCNLHKRIYSFVKEYDQGGLLQGEFAALKDQGLAESRADFFLDPWNSPYWIRDRCSKSRGKRLTFVYSFGPNRRRDSTRYEILGDDVGAWIRQRPLD